MNRPSRRDKTLWQIFALPLLAAIASLVGLVAALLGDGWLNVLAWIGLAVPVWLVGRAMYSPSRRAASPRP
jgi:uncharacterized membrane protein